ncbi:hypothetical protein F5Y17DRAFT_313640 [Xylariaceae sp. FL0594]|nr:hypothetical protein F5Y17DRAFT_313640 [Xylariaceae sp. FL0594]
METRQVLRPLRSLSYSSSTYLHSTHTTIKNPFTIGCGRRHQSTTQRTKKMLKIPPHPDFLTPQSGMNHIIFNPPAAAPSVYHTPFKFLPKSDPRRQANLGQLLRSASDLKAAGQSSAPLPPPSRPNEMRETQYNVTEEQVEEMRQLRASDPQKWSVLELARKFSCTPYFVMMCCKASPEHKDRERKRLEAIKSRWGVIRTKAREERKKRKVMLLRGEL